MDIKEGRLYFIKDEYYRKGEKIKVPLHIQKEILQKASTTVVLAKREIISTYTDLPKFMKEIEREIEASKNRSVEKNNIEDNFIFKQRK